MGISQSAVWREALSSIKQPGVLRQGMQRIAQMYLENVGLVVEYRTPQKPLPLLQMCFSQVHCPPRQPWEPAAPQEGDMALSSGHGMGIQLCLSPLPYTKHICVM